MAVPPGEDTFPRRGRWFRGLDKLPREQATARTVSRLTMSWVGPPLARHGAGAAIKIQIN